MLGVKRPRVNGHSLGRHIHRRVTLIGTLVRFGETRKHIELDSTDLMKINISLPNEIDAEIGAVIEVCGTAASKATIRADSYIVFDAEESADFDPREYNDFLRILHLKINQNRKLKIVLGY